MFLVLQAAYLKEIVNAETKKALVIGAGRRFSFSNFFPSKIKSKKLSIINRTNEKSLFLKKKFKYIHVLNGKI